MTNDELIADVQASLAHWASHEWEHKLLTRVLAALEAQSAPLVIDGRGPLAELIDRYLDSGMLAAQAVDEAIASGVVSLAADRDRAVAERAWDEADNFLSEWHTGRKGHWELNNPRPGLRTFISLPKPVNPYRESEGE